MLFSGHVAIEDLIFYHTFQTFKDKKKKKPLKTSKENKVKIMINNVVFPERKKNLFAVFVADNTTMSSTQYFENHVNVSRSKPKEVNPIKVFFV